MKSRIKILAGLLAAGTILLLASCGGQSAVMGENEDMNGGADAGGTGRNQPMLTVGSPPGKSTIQYRKLRVSRLILLMKVLRHTTAWQGLSRKTV